MSCFSVARVNVPRLGIAYNMCPQDRDFGHLFFCGLYLFGQFVIAVLHGIGGFLQIREAVKVMLLQIQQALGHLLQLENF